MKITLFIFIFFGTSELVKCADILAVIPTPFYSHQATFRPLWRELAKRGHKITLITTDPMEANENITQIDYHGIYQMMDKDTMGNVLNDSYNLIAASKKVVNLFDEFMKYQFTHPGLAELIKNKKKFDIMLVELIMPGWPLLSATFKCPFIGLSTMDGHQHMHAAVGNAIHPAIYPYADLGIGENPSFKDRLVSTSFLLVGEVFFKVLNRIAISYARSFIGQDLPDIGEVMSNTSMIFVNSNPVFFPPRPVTPSTINLGGGLHLAEPKKLPEVRKLF